MIPPRPGPKTRCQNRNGSGRPARPEAAAAGHALDETRLRRFLRRRRRRRGPLAEPEIGDFLTEMLELARRLVPCRAGSVLLDDPERPRGAGPLTLVAAFGDEAEVRVGLAVDPRGTALEGVYRSGAVTAAEGPAAAAAGQRLRPRARRPARSVVLAPVRLERAVCGVLALTDRVGRRVFDARDQALVALLSQNVSRGILNAVDVLKQNELALRDGLTGVWGVRGLTPYLAAAVRGARRRRRGDAAVLFVDVDRLKRINDRHGHRAGSDVLRAVARVLDAVVGEQGRVFRFGGDEFVAVCPELRAAEAEALGREVLARVRGRSTRRAPSASVSVGLATVAVSLGAAPGRREAERLLVAADRALFRAKRAGRARLAMATADDARLLVS